MRPREGLGEDAGEPVPLAFLRRRGGIGGCVPIELFAVVEPLVESGLVPATLVP